MGGPVQQSTFAAALGGAVAGLMVWALNNYAHANIPELQAQAISTIVMLCLAHWVPDTQPAAPTAPKA